MTTIETGSPPLPRDQFPVAERFVYLNHAGVGPLPLRAVAALEGYARAVSLEGGQATPANNTRMEEVRAQGAAIMGVHADDVAFVKNTTEGLAFVANGIDWVEGDRVLVPSVEFPSNLYPWTALRERGVDVVEVHAVGDGQRLPVDLFADEMRVGDVRLVAASWVQYARGWRLDVPALAEVCRAHGALFVVDAIQGLGVLPAEFAAWGVDAAVADGHKWLLGPEGAGLMYTSGPLREQLRVTEPGWHSVVHRGEYEDHRMVHDPTSRRFEGGTPNFAGIWGLGASVDLLLETGVDRVWTHVDSLCTRLVDGLLDGGCEVVTDRRDGGASGIVAFRPPRGDVPHVAEQLVGQGFVVRSRAGAVRAAPHAYNTVGEIDRFLEAVTALP